MQKVFRDRVYSEEGLEQGFFMGQMAWWETLTGRVHAPEAIHRQDMRYRRRLGGDSINREAHQESSATPSLAGRVENKESVTYTSSRRLKQ